MLYNGKIEKAGGNKMIKKELSTGIIEYVFPPKQGQHFGNRIIALINQDKAILIDTGYEHQAMEVVKDLSVNQLTIEKVIITHFHDDHMEGLKVLNGITLYGSSYFQNTLDRWTSKEDQKYFIPTILVDDSIKIQFGEHEVEMISFPGHSICTILVKINDEYIHVADELMFSNNGEPLLPCITQEDVIRQFKSVNKLIEYINYNFIFGHGDNIKDKNQIINAIENTIVYLKKILNNNNISFEEATKECTCTFLHKEWHDNVYK